jgi:hypothetical protein
VNRSCAADNFAIFCGTQLRFYHDGRFADLAKVVDHNDTFLALGGRSSGERSDLMQYRLSLTFGPQPGPLMTSVNSAGTAWRPFRWTRAVHRLGFLFN